MPRLVLERIARTVVGPSLFKQKNGAILAELNPPFFNGPYGPFGTTLLNGRHPTLGYSTKGLMPINHGGIVDGSTVDNLFFGSSLSEEKTYQLLETLDSIVFSDDFMSKFSITGTTDFDTYRDCGVSVKCYSAIPAAYGYDEFKNSLVNYLKKLGVDFSVAIRASADMRFTFTLRITSAKPELRKPIKVGIDPQIPQIFFTQQHAYTWVGLRDRLADITANPLFEVKPIQLLGLNGLSAYRSSNFFYRLLPMDGQLYFLRQHATQKTPLTASFQEMYDAYQALRSLDIVSELKIGGTKHGFTTLPYFNKEGETVIDIPIRLNLLPSNTPEEVAEAIEAAIEDEIPFDVTIDRLEWNLLRFKLRSKKDSVE